MKGSKLFEELRKAGKADPDELPLADEADVETKCGKVCVKGCAGLDVELKGGEVVYLPYSLLTEAGFSKDGTSFTADFDGFKRRKLTVKGRKLRHLFERLGDHCLRIIRAVHRDFEEGEEPVVEDVTVTEVKA